MNQVNFIFALHNHQPIGNFEKVIEEAYRNCYRPFLEVIKRFPRIKLTQHYTGTLLEWLRDHHPEFIREARTLVGRGQMEILTGSYYEAILPVIPEQDRIGQIRKLSGLIGDLFGVVPRGMWLAERVWEPHLVSTLADAGVEFVVLDDLHFRVNGLSEEQLLGYYRTEDCGKMVDVFPIDRTLRYIIPFRTVDETRHHLQSFPEAVGVPLLVHADDGEKFGVWPGTHESVYAEKWLESFCSFLDENRGWVQTRHFGEILDAQAPLGRLYLPAASYQEMMKWVLPSPSFLRLEQFQEAMSGNHFDREAQMFVRGGFWRNFFVKYPESNHMHKRMLRVARKIESAGLRHHQEIVDHLWAAQCNDPYWHGVFGGLYLPNLRFPIYHHLLTAERLIDENTSNHRIVTERSDFDCDGADEIIVETDKMNLFLKPSTGGHLIELDHKPTALNFIDVLSRREEGYHRRILARGDRREDLVVKEEGLEKDLHFDWYRHSSLVDHFFEESTTVETFGQSRYLEEGDFVDKPYEGTIRKEGNDAVITLARTGVVWREEEPHTVSIRKQIRVRPGQSRYEVDYVITNEEAEPLDLWFGVEFNVGLMAGDAADRYYEISGRVLADRRLRSMGVDDGVEEVRLIDEWLGVATLLEWNRPSVLWRCPLETISLSESGLERVYQSSMVVPTWKFRLVDPFRVRIVQSIERLGRAGRGKKG